MNNFREVNDDILRDWLSFREEMVLGTLTKEDRKHYIYFDENMSDYLKSIKDKDLVYILLIETRLNNNGENCLDACAPKYTYLELNYDQKQVIYEE